MPGTNLLFMVQNKTTGVSEGQLADFDSPLTYRSVTKQIGKNKLVNDVSFEMKPGETVLVCGLNGAGKTSLIRLALDFIRPDAGQITVFGHPATEAATRRRLAFLPERFSPSPELSGRQVLELLCGLRGLPSHDVLFRPVLEQLDFPLDAIDSPSRQYSKGMTQKLGLTATLMARAGLTILDEPFSGLDPVARKNVLDCLQAIRREGRALLFTSHSLSGMGSLCDTVVVIHRASLIFSGSPGEMIERFGDDDLEQAFVNCISQSNRSYA
ncbi:MAG: ABC transporter ATP-binding protein [Burkholderiaceae bacterium]